MSTVVDGSSGNAEVFPMTDDAAGHIPHEPSVQLNRRRLLVQETPQSEGEVAAIPRVVDLGAWDEPDRVRSVVGLKGRLRPQRWAQVVFV